MAQSAWVQPDRKQLYQSVDKPGSCWIYARRCGADWDV